MPNTEQVTLEVPNVEWTPNTLRAYMLARLDALKSDADNAHAALLDRIEQNHRLYAERAVAAAEALKTAMIASRELTDAAFHASQKAIEKAEEANEKRFESVNEFRQTLTDQTATFMPRAQIEQLHQSVTDKISTLTARIERGEGRGKGLNDGWGYLVGAIGIIMLIVSAFRK